MVEREDVLLHTRIPHKVAKWLKERADRDGDSLAGALRRLAITESMRTLVPCWIYPINSCDPLGVFGRGIPPHHLLSMLGQLPGGEARFHLLTTSGIKVTADAWHTAVLTSLVGGIDKHRFVLAGDYRPWTLVSSLADARVGCIEVTLKPQVQNAVAVVKIRDLPGGAGFVAVVYADGEMRYGEVGVQHGAYVTPSGATSFHREGWIVPVEMIIAAVRAPAL